MCARLDCCMLCYSVCYAMLGHCATCGVLWYSAVLDYRANFDICCLLCYSVLLCFAVLTVTYVVEGCCFIFDICCGRLLC